MVILPLNITTSFCCLVFSATRLHLTVVTSPFILVIGHKNMRDTQHCPQENPVGSILILVEHEGKMDTIITYDAVWVLVASPSSLNPCPNFFNIPELRSHFARALKKILCPQSPVNGWAGAVMSPEMYIAINFTPFHLNIAPTTATPAYPIKYNAEGVIVPYTHKERSTIDAKFSMVENYFKTWKHIYQACYDMLDAHVNDEFKVAPPTILPTTE
jgi:hypothetical protein